MVNSLHPETFFDLSRIDFADLFNVSKVYQVLGKHLQEYILAHLVPGIHGVVHPGAHLEGDQIYIGTNTVVEPGAYIKGPTIIGDNCQIRHGAYIRGNVITGNNCVIGHATEVKGAVFLNEAKAGHFAYVGDSILGSKANLGAGTKLANLKIYNDEVYVQAGDYRYSTGLRKMGAIIGDGVEIGCNATTSPGTVIGKKSRIYPNTMISGSINAGYIVKNRAKIEIIQMHD